MVVSDDVGDIMMTVLLGFVADWNFLAMEAFAVSYGLR